MKHLKRMVFLLLDSVSAACSSKPNNSPATLVGAIDSGPGAAILTFRADSTCEWIAGMMDSPQIGRYSIQDSLIDIRLVAASGLMDIWA